MTETVIDIEDEIKHERNRASYGVVYYLRRTSDGMIKIGHTTMIRYRMQVLGGEFGELQLLMTYSGHRPEERRAHDRFAAYRIPRTEWFRPALPLLWWICETRQIAKYRETQRPDCLAVGEIEELIAASSGTPEARGIGPRGPRTRGVCQNCSHAIERLDEEIWLHAESRKVSCQLFATPFADPAA